MVEFAIKRHFQGNQFEKDRTHVAPYDSQSPPTDSCTVFVPRVATHEADLKDSQHPLT